MGPAKRLALALFFVTGCLAASPGRAWACSCVPPGTPAEELARSTAVFAGKVIDLGAPLGAIVSSADPVRVTFQVHTVWKGPEHDTLVVTTARESASCGYSFDREAEVLVYAYGPKGDLATGLCSRTRPLSVAYDDLAELSQGTTPTTGSPVQPTASLAGSPIEPALILAGGLLIQMAIVAAVVVLASRVRQPTLRILVWAVAIYLFFGLLYGAVGLYCYNARNWEFYGGLTVPPLFCPMGIFDLLMWPVYVWANLINGFGVFGNCRPFW